MLQNHDDDDSNMSASSSDQDGNSPSSNVDNGVENYTTNEWIKASVAVVTFMMFSGMTTCFVHAWIDSWCPDPEANSPLPLTSG